MKKYFYRAEVYNKEKVRTYTGIFSGDDGEIVFNALVENLKSKGDKINILQFNLL